MKLLPGQIRLPGELQRRSLPISFPGVQQPPGPVDLPPGLPEDLVEIPRQLPFPDEVVQTPVQLPAPQVPDFGIRLPGFTSFDGWFLR